MATAWQVHGNCIATSRRNLLWLLWQGPILHGNCMANAWQLHGNCMATALQLHGNCMPTVLRIATWEDQVSVPRRSHACGVGVTPSHRESDPCCGVPSAGAELCPFPGATISGQKIPGLVCLLAAEDCVASCVFVADPASELPAPDCLIFGA